MGHYKCRFQELEEAEAIEFHEELVNKLYELLSECTSRTLSEDDVTVEDCRDLLRRIQEYPG